MEKITAQLVDYEGAMKRLGGDRLLFGQLIEIYDEDAPELFDAIRRAARDGDAPSLERAAHRLKGLLANFGAEEATMCSQRLEQFGNAGQLQDAPEIVTRLESELWKLDRALDAYRPMDRRHAPGVPR